MHGLLLGLAKYYSIIRKRGAQENLSGLQTESEKSRESSEAKGLRVIERSLASRP